MSSEILLFLYFGAFGALTPVLRVSPRGVGARLAPFGLLALSVQKMKKERVEKLDFSNEQDWPIQNQHWANENVRIKLLIPGVEGDVGAPRRTLPGNEKLGKKIFPGKAEQSLIHERGNRFPQLNDLFPSEICVRCAIRLCDSGTCDMGDLVSSS